MQTNVSFDKPHITSHFEDMSRDGVIFIKNQLKNDHITSMKAEIDKIRTHVMAKIIAMDRPLKTYTDIAERHLNRLDYRCGFKANIFKEVAEPIIELIKSLSPRVNFTHYWGAIPAIPGCSSTDMHRDIYPIYNNLKGYDLDEIDLMLPPYYFTVLIPLVEITKENGPTEFIKGSHRYTSVDIENAQTIAPLLSPGDLIIFDGRTYHRGGKNDSDEERLIAYITFTANWYHDQTFVRDNYLFPELCDTIKNE